ncbi:hypothetical protein ACOSQ2_012204 [Xanthoceras sorbifolium]
MVSASLRFCVLLVVMFLSFSLADTPSLVPPHIRAGKINTGLVRALGADAEESVEGVLQNGSPASAVRSVPHLFTVGCDRVCSGCCWVVLARSKPPSIGWCNLDGWWTGDRLWIPLKRAVPVFALSGSGGFVVTSVVGGPDRGFSLLCAAACGLGSCVQLRDAV